jgi:pentatricopeptide repeat protein
VQGEEVSAVTEVPSSLGSVVTLVFVDLVSSTAMKAALPGGDVTARNRAYYDTILEPHRRRVEAELATFGGRVVKTAGDDHFLAFGDALQAACWAAALQASHAAEPIATPLGPLQARVGMHTGAPLVDPRDVQDYIGHEVDAAKRVVELASGGQILLSETTAALVRDARLAGLALHPHGERELKGIGRVSLFEILSGEQSPRPLQVGQAVSLPAVGSRQADSLPHAVLLDALAQGRMVGRDAELAEVCRRVDAALQETGATVLLAGEPGIGKTRLATEAALYAGLRGFRVLAGRCEEEGAAPYQPLVAALLEYLHGTDDAQAARAMPPVVACELVRIVPQIASRVPELPHVPPLPPAAAQMALVEAVYQFFAFVTAHEAPLLIFLDDLHWADEGTLTLLHALARRAQSLRLVIVGTYRDVELDTRHPLERTLAAMNRERLYERITLRRLPEPAVDQMVAALLEAPVTPSPLHPFTPSNFVSVLHHETEGNPFFIEEVLKHLVEEGAVYREAGRWCLKPLEEFRVPQSIKVTVGRRLERLAEESRETLTLAAVIGQQFSFEVLLRASGLDEDRLLAMIEECLGAHLVVEQRVGREEVYRFQHAQIRAVLYDALSLRRKARLHERVGAALEAVYAADPEAHLDELAYHFSQVHTTSGMEKAVAYCLQAGEKARHLAANEEALKHLTAALEFLDGLPDDEAHLRLRWQVVRNLPSIYASRQERARARTVLQEYLALVESAGYWWGVAAAHYQSGSYPYPDRDCLERAMEVCEQHGLTDWLGLVRVELAYQLTYPVSQVMPDLPRAEGLLRQTLREPHGLPRPQTQRAYGALMNVCVQQGRWAEAAAVFRESLTRGGPALQDLFWCLSAMENTLADEGKHAAFAAFCEEAQTLLARAGLQLSLNQWYLEPVEPSGEFRPLRCHDDFDAPHLADEWQWHDPSQASAYSLTDRPGYWTLRAAPGTDLWPSFNLNAPRVLREVRGDFALETRMEGDWDERQEPTNSGLLVWKDALNYLRLDKFSMSPWHNGDIMLEARVKGEYLHFGRGRLRGGTCFLRLERTGERFAALCSTDGEHWLTCGTVLLPAGDPLLVGVHAINGMVAHFDYVRVLGKEGA